MTIETLGVDIAKNVFQLHGVNRNGRVVMKRRVMRDHFSRFWRRSIHAQWSSKPAREHSTGRVSSKRLGIR